MGHFLNGMTGFERLLHNSHVDTSNKIPGFLSNKSDSWGHGPSVLHVSVNFHFAL